MVVRMTRWEDFSHGFGLVMFLAVWLLEVCLQFVCVTDTWNLLGCLLSYEAEEIALPV